MDVMQFLHGLHFNDDLIVYHKIQSKADIQFMTFVMHWDRNLRLNREAHIHEFDGEGTFVYTLQHPGA